MKIDIGDIVSKYLKENGYDGLVNQDGECGCVIGDLAPCEHICLSCKPAYQIKADCTICKTQCDGYDESDKATCFTTNKPIEESK